MQNTDKIEITKPDDFHLHLRQGAALTTTVTHAAVQFGRAIIMPNTVPPIVNVASALEYKKQIEIIRDKTLGPNNNFQPLMTLYLTDNTSVEDIKQASNHPDIIACKLYPQGATTNSSSGVSDIKKIYPVLEAMQEHNLALLIHGEVTEHDIDIFDREQEFIDNTLTDIRQQFPSLKITLEHITTKHAVDFILANNKHTAATITPHHLLLNRNDLLVGGIKPHYYCLPILKSRPHQEAIVKAALSGDQRFFAGSDSAPHAINKKESACGCAGIYHGPHTVAIYAEFFATHNQLDKLEAFMSFYGADYYSLKRNQDKITLVKQEHVIANSYHYEDDNNIVPFLNNQRLNYNIEV